MNNHGDVARPSGDGVSGAGSNDPSTSLAALRSLGQQPERAEAAGIALRSGWVAVRCVFELYPDGSAPRVFEERVTLWQAPDLDAAIALAEAEAAEYVAGRNVAYLGLAQAYDLFDEPGHGAEVFSLIRDSELEPEEYLNRFFATGAEHQTA